MKKVVYSGARVTIVSNSRVNAEAGSVVRPVCTGEVWIIVLRGEASQRKRPRGGSSPIGPAPGPPAQTSGMVVSAARTALEIERRVERQQAGGVELDAGVEEVAVDARQDHARR